MVKISFPALIMVLVVASFIGFCVENTFICLFSGRIDNRNMVLPFLWGYGLALLAILALFGTPQAPKLFGREIRISGSQARTLYYFLISFLCVCIGEIILGTVIERTCSIIWWDYSALPLHITRYTSVPTSIGFATLITVFMKYVLIPLHNAFARISLPILTLLASACVLILSLDMLNSLLYMIRNKSTLKLWSYSLDKPIFKIIKERRN